MVEVTTATFVYDDQSDRISLYVTTSHQLLHDSCDEASLVAGDLSVDDLRVMSIRLGNRVRWGRDRLRRLPKSI